MTNKIITHNKKAFHEYFVEDEYEAGIMLEGWEIKSIRDGGVQLKEAYVIIKDHALYLIGSHISPLITASSHVDPDPIRTRKLLLNKTEITKILKKVNQAGYTVMPLDMHYKNGFIKLTIGLAKGKKQYDKRATEKDNENKRTANQVIKQLNRD